MMTTVDTSQSPQNSSWLGTREHALSRLQDFVPQAIHYAARRNYALPGHVGVSCLSPYLRHRLISEDEVIASVASAHDVGAVEKFIQEVVWRTYWKGALHLSPSVWSSFEKRCDELIDVSPTAAWAAKYEAAKAGRTHLSYFNDWVDELTSTGYLHNHVRMWFASIWIFTLKIPWQLGAAFMYHHLLDGDPASNTLSWRWVAGLHTKGKTYLARADNIAKYSEGRWTPKASDLATEAFRIEDDVTNELPAIHTLPAHKESIDAGLIVTTDDLSIETTLDVSPFASICVYEPTGAEQTDIKRMFIQQATQDLKNRIATLRGEGSISTATSVGEISAWREAQKLASVFIVQPQVGPLSTCIAEASALLMANGASMGFVRRMWDSELFPLCDKGFFTMWERCKKKWERGQLLSDKAMFGGFRGA